jgi:LPS sulfotransferase NodH
MPRRLRRMKFDSHRLMLKWRRALHQAHLLSSWWLRSHAPYQPLFVIASARSGSTLLMDYISRVPGLQSYCEVLCNLVPEGPRKPRLPAQKALLHIRRSLQALRAPIRGCKLLIHQFENCGLTLDTLDATFPSAKYIVLYRESLAEQFVSFEVATATKQWILFDKKESKRAQITVDPNKMSAFCQKTRQTYEFILAHPAIQNRGIVLSYERLVTDPTGCLRDRICPLLDAPPVRPKTVLLKQNAEPLAQRVANYADVADLITSALCRQAY